jgi:hypothetical protein
MLGIDLNLDGRQDLLVVDDRGRPSPFFMNLGDGRFIESQTKAGLLSQGWGMTAAAGDFSGIGRNGLYFTNIDLTAGHRIQRFIERAGETATAPGYARLKAVMQGNKLFRPAPIGQREFAFVDDTEKAGVAYAGEAPAGAQWLDYNNDGRLDLYVANGLWTAAGADYAAEFARSFVGQAAEPQAGSDANQVMRMLQKTGRAFAGAQRNRLFRNNGDGTFTEVGYVTGADRAEDGYAVAVADLDRKGRLDIVLRNADPSSLAAKAPAVTLLRNVSGNAWKSLTVALEGARGPASAIGARIIARTGKTVQVREITAVEGAVQSEPVAFFGLGAAAKVDSLEVRWPSGLIDSYQGVASGRLTAHEGETKIASSRRAQR